MPGTVKVTIEIELDPSEETTLVVKPFGTTLIEESGIMSPIGMPGGGPVHMQTRTLTEKGTGTDRSPDASDNDYD